MSKLPRAHGEEVEGVIFTVRGKRVMLDYDLARLYRVPTKALVQAVRRNSARFPSDFMFQLTVDETATLRSHIVTSNNPPRRGGRRYAPHAFTEQGVAMLSSVLRSRRAIQTNIAIMRAFVRMRQALLFSEDLERKVNELEKKVDGGFKVVFDALRDLMTPPKKSRTPIGFRSHRLTPTNDAQGAAGTPRGTRASRAVRRRLPCRVGARARR